MKQNIKTALRLLLWFVCFSIAGSLIGGILYMIYTLCSTMVAGAQASVFSFPLLFKGIVLTSPVVLIISGAMMVFFIIRNKITSYLVIGTYTVLYIITWLAFLPLMINANKAVDDSFFPDRINISAQYFRTIDDSVLFYSKVNPDNSAEGVCIEDSETFTFKDVYLPKTTKGFTDTLIQTNIVPPLTISIILEHYTYLIKMFSQALAEGYINWLCFSMMGIALLCTASVRHCSKWRLISFISIVFLYTVITYFNILATQRPDWIAFFDNINQKLSFIFFCKNPLLLICNFAMVIVFTVFNFILEFKYSKTSDAQKLSHYDEDEDEI